VHFQTPLPDDALQWFLSLQPDARSRFLAALAHNLTIAGRVFLSAVEPQKSDPVRARAVNEILHKVTSYLSHVLKGDENIVWAPIVTKHLLEHDDREVQWQVKQAWHYAMSSTDA
jgi:16S rRNA G527 N7-methylase RsmG